MQLISYLFIAILGLLVGSFVGAFSYRFPRGIKVSKGRSKCDSCGKQIEWFDNIPLYSFFHLRGKCRNCGKRVSPRYPLIEAGTGVLFLLGALRLEHLNIPWFGNLGILALPLVLFITALLVTIFVIDWEHQIIPDSLTFVGLGVILFAFLLSNNNEFYAYLLSGLSAAAFLLLIHLATLGRGMGLGDVKFALFGVFLGPANTIVWILFTFIFGGVVGLLLIATKKAGMKDKVAFGPFLIIAFFVVLYSNLSSLFLAGLV